MEAAGAIDEEIERERKVAGDLLAEADEIMEDAKRWLKIGERQFNEGDPGYAKSFAKMSAKLDKVRERMDDWKAEMNAIVGKHRAREAVHKLIIGAPKKVGSKSPGKKGGGKHGKKVTKPIRPSRRVPVVGEEPAIPVRDRG